MRAERGSEAVSCRSGEAHRGTTAGAALCRAGGAAAAVALSRRGGVAAG